MGGSSTRNPADPAHKKQFPSLPINHIRKNIMLQNKIATVKDIQLFYRNNIKEENTEKSKRFREQQQQQYMEIAKKQLSRWEEFKERRHRAQELYVQAIKRRTRG